MSGLASNFERDWRDTEIELCSGAFLDIANPDPADISLWSIATGLSNTCRFGGQCAIFYGVASHAVLVSERLEYMGAPRAVQMAGLHHDDPEAFICDMASPVKRMVPAYKEIELKIFDAIQIALDLQNIPFDDPRVKQADDWALAAEAAMFLPSGGTGPAWAFIDGIYTPGDLPEPIAFPPEAAYVSYISRHLELDGHL